MLLLKYIFFSTIAYFVFWRILTLLISLPGMGLGIILMRFVTKGETTLKKILVPVLGFISYPLNFTINAIIWAFIINLITLNTITAASHPTFYFLLGGAFAFWIVAPSGETDLFTAIQSLACYLFLTAGTLLETLYSNSKIIDFIYFMSPLVFILALLIGAIISIVGMLEQMKNNTLNAASLKFGKSQSIWG